MTTDPFLDMAEQAIAGVASDDEARGVIAMIEAEKRRYRAVQMFGGALPPGPLEQALELDGDFRVRAHLTYLSARIAAAVERVESGESVYLRVSMPPRYGKTRMIGWATPVWLLRKHPDWSIVLTSNESNLATLSSRQVRRTIENDPGLGVTLASDAGAVQEWETSRGGGVVARGLVGNLVGRGARCLIMDDMVKSFVAAHSPVTREAVWNWWLNVAQMRLEHPVLVIAVGCLTSDTPVLLADGTERRIENVRPGDRVVAYEGGRLVNRPVLNWANQGPDHVYSLRMESGRVVRANARHPFLTVDSDGSRTWKRMDRLNAGEVILRATGASGGESLALTRAATSMSSVRGCAPRITTKHGGQRDTTGTHLKRTEGHTCATGTALTRRTSGLYSLIKVAPARSVNVSRTIRTPEDGGSSSLITAMTLSECAACSATTATSSSDTGRPSNDSSELSSTYALTTDRVESVVLDGYEDVFDIEVEGAHTFIANGLVTHNTRWHQDDFLGRLGSDEYEGDPGRWEDISLPAFAEAGDLLGRAPGEPLISPLRDETPAEARETLEAVKVSAGTYAFAAQFQARPAPAQGAIFDTTWWRYWTTNPKRVTPDDPTVVLLDPVELVKPNRARVIESWDCAFKDTDGSDYVVGQWWAKQGVRRYLLDQTRNRLSFNATVKAMQEWAQDHRTTYARYVEDKANGTAVIDVLKDTVEGMLPINPTNSKEARARAVTPECEAGNVYLPHPSDPGNEWVAGLLSELRQFPHDVHDDQVDALTQALTQLRDMGEVTITVPGNARGGNPLVAQHSRSLGKRPNVSPIRRTR